MMRNRPHLNGSVDSSKSKNIGLVMSSSRRVKRIGIFTSWPKVKWR
jgi:hypothetical protein